MDGGLPADQRAHPIGVLELDARRDGYPLLPLGRMERREYHRQLEQCGYRRLRRRPRQTWRRYFPLSARTDRLDRVRTRNPSEGHPRPHSRPPVCAYSKESGAKRLYELLRSAYRHELDRLDSRPQCLGSCAAAIRPTTQSALSPVGSLSGCLQSSTTNAGEEVISVRRLA